MLGQVKGRGVDEARIVRFNGVNISHVSAVMLNLHEIREKQIE